ncbi:FtsP/CotA-like multicopper oxidase with cupredoxin domain [Geomicrobium halophilum]|uniref:FtsP/CotA-like multicopper oxidase with cupredoxin domain n=1 Tax=Geomicrobium halophilum TaxID=549000 RepID=A0A841PPD0_9BACL|nr:multicopper oxidase family protein [Geomicrobium halophilum]MBB6449664.1 FtsP/CotA-like multicopper oxidase with cupredoxin domain [Geomicrobium halophilum]
MKKVYIGVSTIFFVLAGCSGEGLDEGSTGSTESQQEGKGNEMMTEDGKEVFNLDVTETHWMFDDETMTDAWTYNGSVPGEEIRVQEGDEVILNVQNNLEEPTALHLHGFPVPNAMDGVPGVTQNAIMPGEEFTYEYQADVPGTYWYHSHQDGSTQVDQGLYGVFIVEPEDQESYDVDEVIAIDEFAPMDMDMEDDMHEDMDHSDMENGDMEEMDHADMMNEMYDTMVINGQSSSQFESVDVEEGDKVKLRFVNAGLFTQIVSIPEHAFKVTHYDGQPVNEAEMISDTSFQIAPAERYDVEIEMDNPGAWGIQVFAEENQGRLNASLPLIYDGYEDEDLQTGDTPSSSLDLTTYGEAQNMNEYDINKEYDMNLGTDDGGDTFTINGKQFPDHEIYEVEEGDVVKVTIENDTEDDHPMHLHGEFFDVISKDGEPLQGSSVTKDTLNVRPGETHEIVFEAQNPGNWMFHCHEFHHASDGMVAEVQYEGFEPAFTPDPNVPNQPE